MNFNLEKIRLDFPILNRKINGTKLIYFDSAASSQRPLSVINSEIDFYKFKYAAVHRGIHSLSIEATTEMENIRKKVACFINAKFPEEIIFVKGATEAINLVAQIWSHNYLKPSDNIIITEMEHHSNIVPWQIAVERVGARLKILPLKHNGELDSDKLIELIDEHTKLLAITHISNVLGTINPIQKLIIQAKKAGLITLVDGAQAIMHKKIDVQEIDCDFYVFSGHKMYGPTGIGILYGRKSLLNQMPPWQGGGSMVSSVQLPQGTTWNQSPWKFEAGTPHTAGIIGLGAAIHYIENIGIKNIQKHEDYLTKYALHKLKSISNINIYGSQTNINRIGVISFNMGKYHPYDIGSFLDQYGIAIRTGHHCAMPIMKHYNVNGMCRISLGLYNCKEEVDQLIDSLIRINNLLSS